MNQWLANDAQTLDEDQADIQTQFAFQNPARNRKRDHLRPASLSYCPLGVLRQQ